MPSKELIEKVAEAIADADGEELEFYPAYYNALAQAALSTILPLYRSRTRTKSNLVCGRLWAAQAM